MYNKCVEDYNVYKQDKYMQIKNRVNRCNMDLTNEEKWLENIPHDTRVEAIRSFCSGVKGNITKLQKGMITKFKMHFMSKKKNNDIFFINKRAIKISTSKKKNTQKKINLDINIFPKRLKDQYKEIKIRPRERKWIKENISKINHFCSIIRYKDGRYYLNIPYDKKIKPELNQLEEIVSLDPGIRTFQTYYSKDTCGKIGDEFTNLINKNNFKIDKLKSIISSKNIKSKTRCKLRKRCHKLRTKTKNIVNDLHWKSASFLTKNYKVILIPSFNTQKMVKKKLNKRKIRKITARNMLDLSHYRFKTRLMELGKQYGSHVIECKEHYTSKTCGGCGNLNHKLGGSKVYECKKCNFEMDRDLNGARNILIKNLTLFTENMF